MPLPTESLCDPSPTTTGNSRSPNQSQRGFFRTHLEPLYPLAYAETLSHELSHWTEHRMGWSGSYALGELRAEMAAIFVTAALGIPGSNDLTNHVAYLQSWLEALENDPQFLFKAAAAASKSADFILSFSRQIEAQAEAVVGAA